MNSSPHAQHYAYRRNPAQSVHPSTFHPQQYGHGHGGGAVIPTRPPQPHYTTSVSPFQPASQGNTVVKEKEKEKKSGSGGFNLASLAKYANIDELKGLVDRFGGLEGILSTVTTVQKVVSTVGQIAPMVKVFSGVLGKNKNSGGEAEAASIPARRRVRSTRPQRSTKSTTNRAAANRTASRPAQATARPAPVRRSSPPPPRTAPPPPALSLPPRRPAPTTRRPGNRR